MMKLLPMVILGMVLSGCGDNAADNKDLTSTEAQSQVEAQNTGNEKVLVEDKFLITDNSAGQFKIEGPWEDIAKNDYNYLSVKGNVNCRDGVCESGFGLGSKVTVDEDGGIENQEVTIGDGVLMIYSDAFKTKEGIGVGSTLEELDKALGEIIINLGWLEEDADAIKMEVAAYPNVNFILDIDDAIGGYDTLKDRSMGGTATISEFKPNTKIKKIIINPDTIGERMREEE